MSRPKSMTDFSALLGTSTSVTESFSTDFSTDSFSARGHPRQKPSLSLAAGLIMASESPKSQPNTPQPQPKPKDDGRWSGNLFYAYAQKSDYAQSPPYILTFSSAAVCDQWWSLVQKEYPDSVRNGPQLFILKSDDMREQIQDNPKFYQLRDKWFYTPSDGASAGVIPLQDYKGNPVPPLAAPPEFKEETKKECFHMSKLSAELGRMNDMISENSSQIRALSVAQSEGLQRMQEINEANTTQIKALADGQAKLQSIMDQNATHYIALSNSAFSNQEHIKSVLQTNAEQIKSLAEGQTQLAKTCESMMYSIEHLGTTVSANLTSAQKPSFGGPVSPGPRKLNRRVKGVWYEYDANSSPSNSPKSSPRRNVTFVDTPPRSPLATKDT